jgi:hypothetical protein
MLEHNISMRFLSAPRFLVLYSAAVTLAFMLTVYVGFIRPVHGASKVTEFDRIRAHRIDLVEPDGTERMILSNRIDYPGSFFHNKEVARPDRRDSAGMLFLDDEGNESGGLIFSGNSTAGQPNSGGHLSFDNYQQDQTLALDAGQENGRASSSVKLLDQPTWLMTPEIIDAYTRIKAMPDGPDKTAAITAFTKTHPFGHARATLADSEDGSVSLKLSDRDGHPRLVLNVAPDGKPSFKMFDSQGHAISSNYP